MFSSHALASFPIAFTHSILHHPQTLDLSIIYHANNNQWPRNHHKTLRTLNDNKKFETVRSTLNIRRLEIIYRLFI